MRRRAGAVGFSIFEMLIALALAAGLSMLAATSFAPAASRGRLKAEAAEIASQLSAARTRAITERTVMHVRFDAGLQTIVAGWPAVLRELPASLRLAVQRSTATDDEDALRIDVAFYPDGSATGGAFSLSDGTQAIAFRIDWLTGRVSTDTVRARAT